MPRIITIGEILVEIMAVKKDQNFLEVGEYQGPFPSGAPAIFIDQVAKAGSSCGIIGCVGADDFGRINYNRLRNDGVDISHIYFDAKETTGTAFVTYKNEGSRNFIFHLKNTAAGKVQEQWIDEEYFNDCKYLHIMGCSLFNENMRNVVRKAVQIAKKKNAAVSFDPNIRKEILKDKEIKDMIDYMVEQCDIFLPGEEELSIIAGTDNEEKAVKNMLSKGLKSIIVKRGRRGCTIYSQEFTVDIPPFEVNEIDPTGAGDCFGGTLISCLNQGLDIKNAVLYANAAGAMAVMRKGPMEGNSTLIEIKHFINEYKERASCKFI
jgi:tagatose kinase